MKLGDLDFRKNSIGFLRFFFAATVIWSHAFGLGGFGYDALEKLNRNAPSTGLLAVGGFFVLSGFLIARSFESVNSAGRFLWHRFLRIFPGYWVCLILTAFVFAPLAFSYEHRTLSGFFLQSPPAWSYVSTNFFLELRQWDIGKLLGGVPYPFVFNSSLWTLQYEFFCYLCLAVLGIVGVLRRAPALVALVALGSFIWYVSLLWRLGGHGMPAVLAPIGLFVYFALGVYAYLVRDRIPIRGWLALLCLAALLLTIRTPAFAAITIPCIAYLTLFAAMRLPIRNFDRRADLSYGLYIYAFAIAQLLAMYGLGSLGFTAYFIATLALALIFAAGSWYVIEKPCLQLKSAALPLHKRRTGGKPSMGEAV